jgi:uncharacterized repeat protein (TIGR01451 family)
MKKSLLLSLLLALSISVTAQNWVTIPDAGFANKLNQLFPTCMNGNQMNTECPEVMNETELILSNLNINNLTGIEHFVNLQILWCDNNNLTTLPNLPPNLTHLKCWLNNLTSITALPSSLIQLECYYNPSLQALPGLPATLTTLDCHATGILSLPQLPASLLHLICHDTQIFEFPQLPASLITFDCSYNYNLYWGQTSIVLPASLIVFSCTGSAIDFIPNLPPTLEELYCGANGWGVLPELPSTLTRLSCINANLTNLPELPASLQYLNCYNNNLTALPELPTSLIELHCRNNAIANLPELSPLLEYLNCSSNDLTSLPELPATLDELICNSNPLSNLPELPGSLTHLYCYENNLTALPELPNSMLELYCQNNSLTSLPELPTSLEMLQCYDNLLTSLPELPSLSMLRCQNNLIACLPTLPSTFSSITSWFNISNNFFTCLPNYNSAMSGSNAQWLAYPICDMDDLVGNPIGCSGAAGIAGTVYLDENANCIIDAQENQLLNIPLKLYNQNGSIVSSTSTFGSTVNNLAVYQFMVTTGTYDVIVETENMPFQASCTTPGTEQEVTLSGGLVTIQNVDFGIECLPSFDIGVQSVVTSGWVFPGQQHTLRVVAGDLSGWYGLSCAAGVGGTVSISVVGPVNYLNPAQEALSPDNTAGNTFTYDIADFGAINPSSAFRLVFETDTTAQADDQICVTINVTPSLGDYNPENNSYQQCYSVINSYDPNIKIVWPSNVEPGYDDYFNYTIYFQNTGNAPAFNIRLADTLDTNLDLNTFQVINYSHPVLTYLNGNVLTFRFNNIMLPDSTTDLEGSIGFVQYRIKPIAGLPVGTVIENTAHIFFDFNNAIVTNTTMNEYVIPTSVANVTMPELLVFPNPGTGLFNVSLKNGANLNHQSTLEIYNLSGQRILQQQMNENQTVLDLSTQPAGIYMLRLQNTFGTKTMKLVKQ